ncbi:MAG: Gfo/Idh/MocA family oxidoreductase [Ruminococcaceae bacterium]|nr:Gfo/Idh/MocA family oxidoreductase [Oscillospiraceae bacterium]
MKKVRIGLIGCGGRAGSHMKSFLEMEDVEVTAVADPIEERRLAAAEKFGCQNIYQNHTELLDHAADLVDALVICVEPTAHEDMELRAVELGIPFLVEKPMSVDLELAERVNRAVLEKNLLTAVGFQDRYQDLTDLIKEELPKHKAGGLVWGSWIGGIPGVWWWQKKTDCGGQLVEQNIHLLDELRYLFGEPLSVYATASRGIVKAGELCSEEYDTDDHSTAVLRFENNITATLVSGCYIKKDVGTRPRCGLYIMMEDILFDYRLRNNLIIETKNETRDIKRQENQTYTLDRAFVDALKTGDRSLIRSDYADAMKSLRLAFAANRSMETGEVIYFDKAEQ